MQNTYVSAKLSHVVIALILVAVCTTASADWPQFQGPDRNGISKETGLARSWPTRGPNKLWSIPLGAGFAGPAVRDGEVYILDRTDFQQDVLRVLSLDTGEELWTYSYHSPGEVSFNGSRTTPTVTEKYVFSVGMMGDFYCIDRATHKPVWSTNLLKDFKGADPGGWGVAQSPSLYKDMVIVAPQAPNAFVVAFRQATGEIVWKSSRVGGWGYSTPVIETIDGVDQAVMIGQGKTAGISMEDGSILWSYDGWKCRIPIPYPMLLPGNRVFLTGEYGAGSAMIQIARNGNQFTVKELFKTDDCGSQIHEPLFYDNHLYMNSNGNRRNEGMLCLTLEGEVLWQTRDTRGLPRFERGNLLMADRMIISLDGKKGTLHLVDPSPEGFKQLASAKVLDGPQAWSPMALSQGKLLVRNQTQMICLDLRNP